MDTYYMHLALKEAVKGVGRTTPNPCVGAVIVGKGSLVVGRGYHKKAGTPHAEIHALADAGRMARGGTMYVTLEPCNHTGRTPPCSHAIVNAGISRVVIGMRDPNPLACGGIKHLLSQNITVVTGVCEEECRLINLPFIKHVSTGLPWVVMKAGVSLDGRISYWRGQGGGITGKESALAVHSLRNNVDAILVGIGTALVDNPSLTTRLLREPEYLPSDDGLSIKNGCMSWQSEQLDLREEKEGKKVQFKSPLLPDNLRGQLSGGCSPKDPLRILLDSELRLFCRAKMLSQVSDAQTWIFCSEEAAKEKETALLKSGAVIHRVACGDDGHLDLCAVLKILGKNNITSLLVEGGSAVHGSFLHHKLFDELYLFMAPFFIGDQGTPLVSGGTSHSASLKLKKKIKKMSVCQVGDDILVHGFFADPASVTPSKSEI